MTDLKYDLQSEFLVIPHLECKVMPSEYDRNGKVPKITSPGQGKSSASRKKLGNVAFFMPDSQCFFIFVFVTLRYAVYRW